MDAKYSPSKDISISFRKALMNSEDSFGEYHDSFEIALFIEADMAVFLKNQQYHIKNHCLLLIGDYEIHRLIYGSNMNYRRVVLNFKQQYVLGILKELGQPQLLNQLLENKNRLLHLNLKQFNMLNSSYEFLQECKDEVLFRLKTIELLIQLAKIYKSNALPVKSGIMQEILEFLDNHFAEPITLEELENRFYLSRFHLMHAFKKVTGFTMIEYLQTRRIMEAKRLLKETNSSITEVCYSCGFNNIQHFCRVFKRLVRTTPLAFRKGN